MIRQLTDNHIQAVTQFGEVVAEARRSGKGNLWYVYLTNQRKDSYEAAHVRISGKLNERVQRQLVIAALTATTGVKP